MIITKIASKHSLHTPLHFLIVLKKFTQRMHVARDLICDISLYSKIKNKKHLDINTEFILSQICF